MRSTQEKPNATPAILLLIGFLVAGWPQGLRAAPADPTLADYRATYEREQAKICTNNVAVPSADADYLKALEALLAAFKRQGDLDSTLAVMSERKRFEATRMVPDAPTNTLPTAVFQAQTDYRAVLARAELEKARQSARLNAAYVKALKELIKMYMAADKMAEAEAVNKEIKKAEAEAKWAEAEFKNSEAPLPENSAREKHPDEADGNASKTGEAGPALSLNLRNGLVLYYSFSQAEGTKIRDASGKRNDGTVKGATWTPRGRMGGGMQFDGQNDYVMVSSDSPAFKRNGPDAGFAIAAWFKTSSAASQMLLSKGVSDENEEYSINILGDEKGVYFDYGGSQAYVVIDASVTDNKWHLLVATYHASWSPKGRVYIDGEEKTVYLAKGVGPHIATSGSNLYIGTQNEGSPYYGGRVGFVGSIDEVAVWNRSLDADAVRELYRKP